MQDPFIFNLEPMGDNDEMKENVVEIKSSKKIKNRVPLKAVRCRLLHLTTLFPT